jgi:hypothetical protein
LSQSEHPSFFLNGNLIHVVFANQKKERAAKNQGQRNQPIALGITPASTVDDKREYGDRRRDEGPKRMPVVERRHFGHEWLSGRGLGRNNDSIFWRRLRLELQQ